MGMSILEAKNLHKSFGKTRVIDNLSFVVKEREISSIIGPNGAGKTTLFNLCTGHLRCDYGQVFFRGRRIDRLSRDRIVRMGLGRAFQRVNIFPELTVFENIRIPVVSHLGMSPNFFRDVSAVNNLSDRVLQILEDIGMADRKDNISGKLDHGEMKLLDIGIALALKPKLLFLDEPTAGMTPEERRRVIQLINRVCEDRQITLVLIEHDMDVVFAISQKIRVLNYGKLLAEGTPEEISQNPQVIEAYLGESLS